MFLYRVATGPSAKRVWMTSDKAFTSVHSVQLLTLVAAESSLFELRHQLASNQGKQELVHYSQLVAPIANDYPPMVLGIGLNYAAHSLETQSAISANREGSYPIVFGKSPRSVIGPSQAIEIPRVCSKDETDFEVELAIVIGRECKNVPKERAMDYVLGFTCANDVSARKWQGKHRGGGQWSKAKSFDTFCPLGPGLFIPPPPSSASPVPTFSLESRIKKSGNAEFAPMQNGTTRDLIYDVAYLVEFLSQDATLPAWTVILTGTPAGVGYTRKPSPVVLEPGDEIECQVREIGTLWNPITQAPSC
ncbi:hypothetical protein BASA81_000571 [Batrachochytrium salamandrivorans]|nr:hypothetical protein BASA81_000571 [Batrachochytrium salamandrivorans]